MVCTVAETALLMAVGMLFYHLHLPTSPGRWWTFAWVFVLGSRRLLRCSASRPAACRGRRRAPRR